MDDVIRSLIIGLIMVGIFYSVARNRKPQASTLASPSRSGFFKTNLSGEDVFKAIVEYATAAGLKIEEMSTTTGLIILSDGPTITSWGFFYPIQITLESPGTTRIDVGIKSKLYQYGPVVTRSHKRMLESIRNSVADAALAP